METNYNRESTISKSLTHGEMVITNNLLPPSIRDVKYASMCFGELFVNQILIGSKNP